MKLEAPRLGTLAMCSLALMVAALAAACGSDYEPCGHQGEIEACSCGPDEGVRRCLPERVWGACVCEAQPGDAGPVGGGGGGPTAGAAGSASAGRGGAAGAAGNGSAGQSGSAPAQGGAGGSAGAAAVSGGGAGSAGGSGQADGSAGTGGGKPPYAACEEDSAEEDCPEGATCIVTTTLMDTYFVCAPACDDADECPEPAGDFGAVLECIAGRCRLNCMPELQSVSCPSGMVCAEDLLSGSYCHAS